MKLSSLYVLAAVISGAVSKALPKVTHHAHNTEVHYDLPIAHETLADYEKALVEKLLSMQASDRSMIALAIATILFIIV